MHEYNKKLKQEDNKTMGLGNPPPYNWQHFHKYDIIILDCQHLDQLF